MRQEYPILEFDATPEAVIEPAGVIKAGDVPERCVLCFFQDVIEELRHEDRLARIACSNSEMGENPIYAMEVDGKPLVVCHPGVGAPFAAWMLEELIALGCRKFVACGGAGVLDREIACGQIVVPLAAIRDEGTSYHYLPPSREVKANSEAVAAIEQTLQHHGYKYVIGKTWTTDGIYRETPTKVQLRRPEGCVTVEMEAAAFFAVAQHRRVLFGHMLYGGDNVSGASWDHREWTNQLSVREKLLWLAAEACLSL